MASPITLPILPNFQIPFFTSPSSTTSPFSSSQQTILQNIANSITSISSSVVSSGSQDLYNTEQFLISKNTTLQNTISQVLTLLTSSTNTPAGLTTVLNAFNTGVLANGVVSYSSSDYTFPLANGDTLAQLAESAVTFLVQPGLATAEVLLTPGSSNQNLSASYNIYNFLNSQTGGPQGTTAQGFVRPLINSLFGVNPTVNTSTDPYDELYSFLINPGSNTFIVNTVNTAYPNLSTVLTSLIASGTSAFPSGTIITDIISLVNSFNTSFSNGNVNYSTSNYLFPISNGDSLTQWVQSITTLLSQPGLAVAEILLTPGSSNQNLSASYNIYNFLSSKPGQRQSVLNNFVAPLINALFLDSPTDTSSTSPFNQLYNFITNPGSVVASVFSSTKINVTSPLTLITDMISNPGNFAGDFSGLFNTGTIGSSGIKPYQIVYDMFTNPGNVLNDFTVIAATGLSTSNVVGGNVAQIFSDIFSVNSRALNNLASDIFSFASLSDFGISGLPNGGIVSILQALQGMFNNFTSIGNALWIGSPAGTTPVPGATYAFLSVDTVYPGYVWWGPDPPSGQPSKPAGYWAADTGGLILPNIGSLQGANYGGQSLQGNLGYIVACLISSYGELDKSFNNAKNAVNQISFSGWLGAGESAANSVFNTMNSLYFMSQAVFKMFGILSNVLASFQNIQNMLNQAVAPNYLIPTNPFTGQIASYTPSASSGILGVLGTIT